MTTSHFKSYAAYRQFSATIQYSRRYVPNPEMRDFIAGLRATADSKALVLNKIGPLIRAQTGCSTAVEESTGKLIDRPYDFERMIPDPAKVGAGRANPHGIAYLYAASDKETAIAEVRPFVGERVSVAEFRAVSDMRVVNCAKNDGLHRLAHGGVQERLWDSIVWSEIDTAFARPVDRNDSARSYLPTQYIAEVFRDMGFEGVMYQSRLAEGYNLVLFEVGKARPVSVELYRVTSVKYDAKHWGDRSYKPYTDFT